MCIRLDPKIIKFLVVRTVFLVCIDPELGGSVHIRRVVDTNQHIFMSQKD